jgi:hypothetical protein
MGGLVLVICRQLPPTSLFEFFAEQRIQCKVQGWPWRGSRGAEPRVGVGKAHFKAHLKIPPPTPTPES